MEKETITNDRIFVSFRWLFGTSLSILGIMFGLFYFILNRMDSNLEKKIDKEFFNERTVTITEKVNKIDSRLDNINIALEKGNELIKLHIIATVVDRKTLDRLLENKK